MRYLGQMITFLQQEMTEIRNRIRAAWATFHKYRQSSTPAIRRSGNPNDELCIRTGTPTKEHERIIQSTQLQMLRLIIQTTRRYKMIVKRKDENNEKGGNDDLGSTGDESADGQSSNAHHDQDSDVSFENDTDEDIDTTEIEEENWIEYIKRSTDEAMEKMKNAKIRCWNKTHKK